MADEEKRPDADSTAPESNASDNTAPPTGAETPAVEGAPVNEAGATDDVAAAGEPADAKSTESEEEEPVAAKSEATESAAALAAAPVVAPESSHGGGGHDAHGHGDHGHDAHGHDAHGHGDHGFAHVMPKSILLGVLGALIVLTVLTVGVTMVDLGSTGNFIVAMAIATVKAVLVMGFFMHLVWDTRFNAVIFLSSFFFVILFLMVSLLDRQEYQPMIDDFARDQSAAAPK